MIKQRKDEWLVKDNSGYHQRQFEAPYRSTEVFVQWLDEMFSSCAKKCICDLGCGGGANIAYMARKYPSINFEGIEINEELISSGNKKLADMNNAQIIKGDLYHLDSSLKNRYKGIISFQTLSWLPEYNEAIYSMAELEADWIALSSLFYEGDIDYTIQLKNYTRATATAMYQECYYNIYSLNKVRELFANLGYTEFKYKRFDIDVDLPKPEKAELGTYTEKLENGRRIQISGGLMLPWYFIVACK